MACLTIVTAGYSYKPIKAAPIKTPMRLNARLRKEAAVKIFRLRQAQILREAEVCELVDKCQMAILHRVDTFFDACQAKVVPWVDKLLCGQKTIGQTHFCDAVLPQQALDALVKELRLMVKGEAEQFFGVTSITAIKRIDLALRPDVRSLQILFAEYRRTLLVMQLAAEISNRACRQSVTRLKAPFLLGEVLEKLAVGSSLLKLADCCPRENGVRYRQIMITQINGMILTIKQQLVAEACHGAATSFYELYDLIWELGYEREIAKLRQPVRKTGCGDVKSRGERALA